MPDTAKLRALRDANFRVLPTCVSCRYWHGKRDARGERWGACPMIPYQHGKHTGDERMASTPDIGWCLKYEADSEYLGRRLAAHIEFFDEEGISV